MTAIAMTEPGTGSDLAGNATTAVHDRDKRGVPGPERQVVSDPVDKTKRTTVALGMPDLGRVTGRTVTSSGWGSV
ncbi:hypothetical protein [Streptomyces cavernae]|uniref:hypothetical protein n=1 Tax=Streptomyces cavernae TaxID=2259034 RepID=UPI001EE45E72|nr:hypothetical protein [Streptomyces cavernae]